jgi:hypothetical protein
MEYKQTDLGEYAESLFSAGCFAEAFEHFEKQVTKLGFDGVLYTYIPRALLNSNFLREPVYEVSSSYSPGYMKHYADARFEKHDPLIKAVMDGVSEPIDWWGEITNKYMETDTASREVLATSRSYDIANGITLPLMSEQRGIAGASFITSEAKRFDVLKRENLEKLKLSTQMFHSLVVSDACHVSHFLKPILNALTDTELRFLQKLAQGKTPKQISVELSKSEKYLEQVMLNMRRKFSGAGEESPLTLNRNQLLYYAGLLGLIDHLD